MTEAMTEAQKKAKNLADYDIVIAIDKSGSMSRPGTRGKTRWVEAQESTIAIARKAEEIDTNGITVIPFANTHKIYDNVTASMVMQIFTENDPNGGTDTASMLSAIFERYNAAKAEGKAKPIIVLVITDGEPNDKDAVESVIRKFADTLEDNGHGDTDEAGISFLQIGDDKDATQFLKHLDDSLDAKFDIIDTKTFDQLEDMTISEIFIQALEG